MGAADAETKAYLSNADRFADVFNFWIYHGDEVIKSGDLRELDTASIVLPRGNRAKQPAQKFRDVLKLYTAMRDNRAIYLVLGIEAQSHIHYAMPVRNMLYDAMHYAEQVKAIADRHRKAGTKMTEDEFLSGFRKGDRVTPVITLVVSFSPEPWDGPMSLHEMLDTTDERLLSLVPDYRLNLLSPEKIDEPDFDKFRTGIGAVMQFIKHRRDKSVEWLSGNKRFEAIDRDSANLIKTVTGANIRFEEKGASVNMWEAWENSMKQAESKGKEEGREEGRAEGRVEGREEGRAEGRVEGREEGRAEGRVQSIRKMMQKLNLTAKQAMDILDIPVAERAKYAAQV